MEEKEKIVMRSADQVSAGKLQVRACARSGWRSFLGTATSQHAAHAPFFSSRFVALVNICSNGFPLETSRFICIYLFTEIQVKDRTHLECYLLLRDICLCVCVYIIYIFIIRFFAVLRDEDFCADL